VKNPVAAFAGMMTKLDEDVGRVMALLKELGIDENTLVMITSDNGAHREGGHNPKFFKSCGKLRGIKRDLYDGGIRVPLIARWPGRIKAGTTTDHISAHWDVMPTFCDLAGVSAPAKTDGISMLPSLLGQASKQKKHDYLYWEYRGKQAIRMGKWKAVRYGVTKAPEKQFQIFNLEDDISEKKDVASAQPEIAAQMQKIAKSARVESELFRLFKLK
jgi:arylsulfatase A-like enzyme